MHNFSVNPGRGSKNLVIKPFLSYSFVLPNGDQFSLYIEDVTPDDLRSLAVKLEAANAVYADHLATNATNAVAIKEQ